MGDPRFFRSTEVFRRWLEAHHDTAREVWVGYHRLATGKPSMTWSESVDEALCFGWIDGIRKRIDDERYMIRFTPRKGSHWSPINVAKARALIASGRMTEAGRRAFEARTVPSHADPSGPLEGVAGLDAELEQVLRADRKAAEFFDAQAPSVRRLAVAYIMAAKRAETRRRRLDGLLEKARARQRWW